jgi:hypothetical protein
VPEFAAGPTIIAHKERGSEAMILPGWRGFRFMFEHVAFVLVASILVLIVLRVICWRIAATQTAKAWIRTRAF